MKYIFELNEKDFRVVLNALAAQKKDCKEASTKADAQNFREIAKKYEGIATEADEVLKKLAGTEPVEE